MCVQICVVKSKKQMKSTNTKLKKSGYIFLNVYDLLIISMIAVTVISVIIVWAWYGHKDAQIENELLRIK